MSDQTQRTSRRGWCALTYTRRGQFNKTGEANPGGTDRQTRRDRHTRTIKHKTIHEKPNIIRPSPRSHLPFILHRTRHQAVSPHDGRPMLFFQAMPPKSPGRQTFTSVLLPQVFFQEEALYSRFSRRASMVLWIWIYRTCGSLNHS